MSWTFPTISAGDALSRHGDGGLTLVDVRKPAAVAGRRVDGAVTRDPFALGHDDPLTGHDGALACFCVHGHEVSHFAAALLRLHGRDAHVVAGGMEALVAAGAALVEDRA